MNFKKLLNDYKNNGYCIIKSLSSVLIPYIDRVNDELNTIGKSIDSNFDLSNPKSIKEVNKKNFYRAIRYSLGLFSLASNKELINLSTSLKCKVPFLGPSYIRSDVIDETSHAFGWHQDAPCLLGSLNSTTFWIPCSDVNKKKGSIEIIEKSHNYGVLKNKPKAAQDSLTSNNLIIDDNDAPDGKRVIVDLKKGEFIVFHSLLVHRSYYPKISNNVRVSAILRYDDASDIKHREHGYLTSFDNKNINSAPQYRKIYNQKSSN